MRPSDAIEVQIMIFGASSRNTISRIRWIVQTLLCAAYARSIGRYLKRELTLDTVIGELQVGLQTLYQGLSFYTTVDETANGNALWACMEREIPDIREQIRLVIHSVDHLSAIRLRMAYYMACDNDEERCRLARLIPLLSYTNDNVYRLTISNDVFRLQYQATRTARRELLGAERYVDADEASTSLGYFADSCRMHRTLPKACKKCNGLMIDLRSDPDRFKQVFVQIDNFAVLDNVVLFHVQDAHVRAMAGIALRRSIGCRLVSGPAQKNIYTLHESQVDPLNYHDMKQVGEHDAEYDYVNHEVSRTQPCYDEGYTNYSARHVDGIRLF